MKHFKFIQILIAFLLMMGSVSCGKEDVNSANNGSGNNNANNGNGNNNANNVSLQEDECTLCVNGVNFVVIKVEPGTFQMGRGSGLHQVTLTDAYYIGQTEVTQALYIAVMGTNPSLFTEGQYLPVESVSYNEALVFCSRLSQILGLTVTLPTEAQWEYAAMGGHRPPESQTRYSGSDNIDDVAWYGSNSDGKPHFVSQKAPNSLGLYDMSGNVYEWCFDWYGDYSDGPVTNPQGPLEGSSRVIRGGGYGDYEQYSQVKSRSGAQDRFRDRGFRLVIIP